MYVCIVGELESGYFCPLKENLSSCCLFENHSCPFLGTQNDIFINPETTGIKFLISRKFEVTIHLRKLEGIKGLPNRQFTKTIRWGPLQYKLETSSRTWIARFISFIHFRCQFSHF